MNETYLDMLKEEYLDRKARSPLYSERAFARDIKLSSGFVSLLFHQKRRLSPKMCLKVLENLNWNEVKSQKFLNLVQKEQLKEVDAKPEGKDNIPSTEIDVDYFRLISNIDHILVLEFIQSRRVKGKEVICDYFGLNNMECDLILKRLERLKLVEFSPKGYSALPEKRKLRGTPSKAIRNYHKGSIQRSLVALDEQDFKKREIRSVSMSMDPKKVSEAKQDVDRFIKKFIKKFGDHSKGEIYQLNLQLFSQKRKGKL